MRRILAFASPLVAALVAVAAHASFPEVNCGPNLQDCEVTGTEAYLQSIRWIDDSDAECDNATLEVIYEDDVAPDFDQPLKVTGLVEGQRVPCLPWFLRKATLRGILTLLVDENAADDENDCDDGSGQTASLALTALLEIGKGKERVAFADSLIGCDRIDLTPWNDLDSSSAESTAFDANPFNALLSSFTFEDEVRSRANELGLLPAGLSGAPIVVGETLGDVNRINDRFRSPGCEFGCGLGERDARGGDGASVARYAITIRFACPANVDPEVCR